MGEENKNVKKPAVSNAESFCSGEGNCFWTKLHGSLWSMLLKRLNGLFNGKLLAAHNWGNGKGGNVRVNVSNTK